MRTADFVRRHRFILCFAVILTFKFLLAGLFSSDYQDKLFMPFVQGWIQRGGNPYDYFSSTQMFPYPPLMLFFMSPGGFLSLLAGKSVFLASALFKIPLVAFDVLCFAFIARLFPGKKRQITAIYFCSPILLYACYMHGQLDIIPTALLVVSIYFLLSSGRHRDALSSVFISAALCTKFHILAIMPVMFIFVAKRDGWKKALVWELLVPLCVTLTVIAPFWCQGFLRNVLMNREQSVLTQVTFGFASLELYVPVLAVLLVYMRMLVVSRMNDELFFGFSAILFSVFLILIPPMPGRYVWVLPFLVVFYIDLKSNRQINFLIYSLLNLLYLLYFVLAVYTDCTDLYFLGTGLSFLKIRAGIVRNMLFTALFAVHAYIIYYIWCAALRGNSLYMKQNASFVIGISGDSGSGKSTLVAIFRNFFGTGSILTIECDGDHKWSRDDKNWQHFSHLNPMANFLYRQAQDVALLKSGKSVLRRDYNHEDGSFAPPHKVLPKPYVLVTGLHALYLPQLRQVEDLRVYMDIDEKLRRFWKIRRDVRQRGHSLDDVLAQIEGRMGDFHKYIEPQKKHADLLIHYFDRNLADYKDSEYTPHLSLRITAVIGVNFEPLVTVLGEYGMTVSYEFNDDMTFQSLVVESEDFERNTLPVMRMARRIVPRLDYILRQPVVTKNDMWSVIGLVMLVMIESKMNG